MKTVIVNDEIGSIGFIGADIIRANLVFLQIFQQMAFQKCQAIDNEWDGRLLMESIKFFEVTHPGDC